MKIKFKSRLEGIDWIANHTDDEGQFEVLREQLNFNFIYTGKYFVRISKKKGSVAWLDRVLGRQK